MNWRHLVVGVLVYLAALVALAPARLVVWAASFRAPGSLVAEGVSGRVWSGAASRLVVAFPGRAATSLVLEGVSWRVQLGRWLAGKAPLHLTSRGGDLVFAGGLAPVAGRWQLEDFHLDLDLAPLAGQMGQTGGPLAGAASRVRLAGERLALAEPYAGGARGEWILTQDMPRLPRGSYGLELEGEGRRLAIRWRSPTGSRPMQGTGYWDGRLNLGVM